MEKCTHTKKNGESSIAFDSRKWNGVYPRKVHGICKICKQNFELTWDEFIEYERSGELDEIIK